MSRKIRLQVTLTPKAVEIAERLGGGTVSTGIEIALARIEEEDGLASRMQAELDAREESDLNA
jgi:hypothetical protein